MATMVDQKTEHGLKMTMVRVIRAPRERVFNAWLRPEMIRQWFGPPHRAVEEVEVDGRMGGRYEITMGPQHTEQKVPTDPNPQKRVGVRGEYKEVSPYDRLSFTWRGDWQPPDEETLVTISLRDVEGGTELTLEHSRFASEASLAGHEKGWVFGLEKMQKLLET
jgi:uncharacterized protein YndB with AHSA1/START domain